MQTSSVDGPGRQREFEFLCVDDFMADLVDARALASAFDLGLIDWLLDNDSADIEALRQPLGLEPRGLRLLVDLLRANRVIVDQGREIALSGAFRTALQYRDLLEMKLEFTSIVLPDFQDLFTLLLTRPGEFMEKSRAFDLFRYDHCFERTPENYAATKRWMRFTTCLTKYEAQACLKYHDFRPYRRMLDVGGNSGEFALRICKACPGVEATIFDLPLVCEVGQEHLSSEPEAERIRFVMGDVRRDRLPGDHDLVAFKSVLHDWPEADARQMIGKAAGALRPGGTLLIFERGTVEVADTTLPYSMIPNVVFMHFYRSPVVYSEQLAALGFDSIKVQRIDLEMPFHLVTARKAG